MLRVLFMAMAIFAFPARADTVTVVASTSAAVGGLTSQPIGHYEFCIVNPAECGIRLSEGPLRLTPALWRAVNEVNMQVNTAIRPQSDEEIHGMGVEEVWSYPTTGSGDCEDYVLEKRRILHDEVGISLANLLITVVRKPDNEGHAILTLRTQHGDYILDNLRNAVLPWEQVNYKFLKRQSAHHTGRWVTLIGPDGKLLTASRE